MFQSRNVWTGFLAVVFSVLSPVSWGASFAGGTGEPNDPYQVATAEQLISIGSDPNLLSKDYVLVNDIDLDPNLPGCRVFHQSVIASIEDPNASTGGFEGRFDGCGHVIHNLTLEAESLGLDLVGLFGVIGQAGRISHLGIENAEIHSGDRFVAGILAGLNQGILSDCHVRGVMKGGKQSQMLGGLVGICTMGRVEDCSAAVSVTGRNMVGGLVGANVGIIARCASTGTVTGLEQSSYLGGLVGYHTTGVIRACYVTGDVTAGSGSSSLGGLVGISDGAVVDCYTRGSVTGGEASWLIGGLVGRPAGGSIVRCYAIGPVSGGKPLFRGPLVGGIWIGAGSLSHSLYEVQVSDRGHGAVGLGLTKGQLMDPEVLALNGWADDPNWILDPDRDYPRLAWEGTPGRMIDGPVMDWLAGSGTSEDPYQVATVSQLAQLGTASILWDKAFVLVSDLDVNGVDIRRLGVCLGSEFSGRFDGQGHTLRNLTLDAHQVGPFTTGLFGFIGTTGIIHDLVMDNVTIKSTEQFMFAGGLAGWNKGTISGCRTHGTIVAGAGSGTLGILVGLNDGIVADSWAGGLLKGMDGCYFMGGLVGRNRKGEITASRADSVVVGDGPSFSLGGLIGGMDEGIVTDCRATGSVSAGAGAYHLGGLVGSAYSQGTISRCSAAGEVTGGDESYGCGGLAGVNSCVISQCFASGDVRVGSVIHELGGLVGHNTATITDCYATGTVTAGTDVLSVGGLVGYNSLSIERCYTTGEMIIAGENSFNVGCFVGQAVVPYRGAKPNITACFFLAGPDRKDPWALPLTEAQMSQKTSFIGWDFVNETANGTEDIWCMPLDSYPRLSWEGACQASY